MSQTTKNQLFVRSAIALAIMSSPIAASAADIVVNSAVTATQTATANDDDVAVIPGGTLVVTGGTAIDSDTFENVGVSVNATSSGTEAIKSTGDFTTIDFSDNATTVAGITVTTGTVTGAATTAGKGTIVIDGAIDTWTISTGANGTISNTGTGGEVIVIGGTNNNTQTATITNAGTISGTNDAGTKVIDVQDNGSTLTLTNSGTLTAGGTTGTALNVANGNTVTVTNTGTITGKITAGTGDIDITQNTGGTITGAVNLGTNASSTLALNAGSVTGNVTLGNAAQTLTLGGGTITGNVVANANGDGDIAVTANTTTNGDIGTNANQIDDVTISNAVTLNLDTNDDDLYADTITLNGATATLTLGTGAIDGSITGGAAGQGILNFNGDNAIGGTIGGTRLAEVNLATGVDITNGSNFAITTTDLTLNGTSTLNAGSATTTVTDDLVIGSGSFTTTGALTVTDDVTIGASGTITTGAGAFSADAVAVGASGTLTVGAGGMTATSTTLASGATINLGAAFSGTIDSLSADGNGTVNFTADQALGGNIGATFDVATVSLTTGTDLTNAGNKTINTADLTLNGTSTFNAGAAAITVTDDLTIGSGSMTTGAGALAVTDDVTVGAGGTLTVGAGGITSDTITIGSGSTISLGGTYTGTIDGASAGVGTVAFTADQALGGVIGGNTTVAAVTVSDGTDLTNTNNISATDVTIGGGASGTLAQSAGTITANINLDTGSTLTFSGTGTFSGTIDGDDGAVGGTVVFDRNFTTTGSTILGGTDGLVEVTVADGRTLTVGGNIKAETVELSGTGTLNLGNTARTITGAIDMTSGSAGNGTLALGTATHSVSGNFTSGAGDIITSTISTTNGAGAITAAGQISGAATISNSATTIAQITLDAAAGYIADDATYALVQGTGATALTDASIDVNGGDNATALLTFTSTNTNGDINIKIDRAAISTIASSEQNSLLGNALDTIGGTGDTNLDLVQGALQRAETAAAVNDILDDLTPQVDGSMSESAYNTASLAFGTYEARLSDIRSGGMEVASGGIAGVAAGEGMSDRGAWIQGFGSIGSQDSVDGVSGYDLDTVGVAIGADKKINDTTRVGLGLSYANTGIDSDNVSKETDVNTYQISAYASKDIKKFYVDGLVSAAYNEYDTTRSISTIPVTATADFTGQTYSAKVGAGYSHKTARGLEIVPNVGLTYVYNTVEDYTEEGAGALNLQVDNDDAQILRAKVGVDVGYTTKIKETKVRPQARVGYTYDVLDNNNETTTNFAGLGTTFTTESPDTERGTLNAGVGLDVVASEKVTLSADYDYETRSDYDAHNGMLRVRYGF